MLANVTTAMTMKWHTPHCTVDEVSLTASERASNWRACNFWLTSRYRALNHPLKFEDRKNRRYNPTQSPLIPDVSCGPDVSKVERKSSGLNGRGVGAA